MSSTNSHTDYSSNTGPTVLIVGAGAVGSYYGWRLQLTGCKVVCVCRSNYTTVKQNGFQMKSFKYGEDVFKPWQVADSTENAASLVPDGYDYVIVCTKALPELRSTADIIAPVITESKTKVVLIQNGVGIEEPVAERFPHNPSTGVVYHALRGEIRLGCYNRAGHPIQTLESDTNELAKLFEAGGVPIELVDDIQPIRWNKVIWNAGFGPASVLTELHDTHSMLNDPDCKQMIEATMDEIWNTARKIFGADKFPGPYPPLTPQDNLKFTGEQPAYKPSIYVDYAAGNPMEIEVILGNTIREAKKHDIDMPRLDTLYKMMRIAERHHNKSAKQ
ncbi:ketopantoate reductase PanE/ApbA-domain-containing protein [Syncephalis plumigaleata]|nr:ketopantoate reductase PanE/ApbA-domain-containing protein [Syncephalis plumigaleata]